MLITLSIAFAGFTSHTLGVPASANRATTHAVADVDGDGHFDLVYAVRTQAQVGTPADPPRLEVVFGDGSLQVSAPTVLRTGGSTGGQYESARGIYVADFSGDGLPDVLEVDIYSMHYIENLGGRVFAPSRPIWASWWGHPYSFEGSAVVDWNGDGDLDLLATTNGAVLVVEDPASLPAVGVPGSTDCFCPGTELFEVVGQVASDYVALADIDGDGQSDLAWRTSEVDSSLYQRVGQAFVPAGPIARVHENSTQKGSVVTCDLEPGGVFEVAFAGRDELTPPVYRAEVFTFGSSWTNTTIVSATTGSTGLPGGMACGDFDNDGLLELLYADDASVNVVNADGI